MLKKYLTGFLVGAFVAGGLVYLIRDNTASTPTPSVATTPVPETTQVSPGGEFHTFTSDKYQFGFAFSKKYFITAKELDASTTPSLMAVLLLDTQENRDLVEGKITAPREGSTGITINVHKNSKRLTPAELAMADSNWNVSDKKLATTTVAGTEGVLFRWSGLYEGATIVVARGEYAYYLAVSWMSQDDPILKDFDLLLSSLQFIADVE